MFSLLVFMFCFFIGSVVMFFYSLKKRESQFKSLAEEHAQLRVLLRAMESRLDNMEKYMAVCAGFRDSSGKEGGESGSTDNTDGQGASPDPLLHLSFENPDKVKEKSDPGLELLLETSEEEKRQQNRLEY